MKSIQINKFGGPEVLILQDVQIGKPGPKEVLIKNLSIGLNFIEVVSYEEIPCNWYSISQNEYEKR